MHGPNSFTIHSYKISHHGHTPASARITCSALLRNPSPDRCPPSAQGKLCLVQTIAAQWIHLATLQPRPYEGAPWSAKQQLLILPERQPFSSLRDCCSPPSAFARGEGARGFSCFRVECVERLTMHPREEGDQVFSDDCLCTTRHFFFLDVGK